MPTDTLTRAPVARLTTVYGDVVYVSQADWDGLGTKSPLLPIYTRDGRKWSDTPAGRKAERDGLAVPWIHRDNLCPPNIARLGDVAKAAEELLHFIEGTRHLGPQEELLAAGAHCAALREALKMLHT